MKFLNAITKFKSKGIGINQNIIANILWSNSEAKDFILIPINW